MPNWWGLFQCPISIYHPPNPFPQTPPLLPFKPDRFTSNLWPHMQLSRDSCSNSFLLLVPSPSSLNDLGLEKFSLALLFTRIFIPTSFLLVCILHLHYFHDRFLQLTDLQAVVAKEESTIYRWGASRSFPPCSCWTNKQSCGRVAVILTFF